MNERLEDGGQEQPLQHYLQELDARYRQAVDGELYADSPLDAWAEEERRQAACDIGVEAFLTDFARDALEHASSIQRWERGDQLPAISPGMDELVRSRLPGFVVVDSEAAGGLGVERARRFKIDLVVEDIITEVVARLPRQLDAYRYRQSEAADKLDLPGVGTIDVRLHGGDIFTYVTTVEGDGWRIWNCRPSGVSYLNRRNDISRPSEISVADNKLALRLYNDDGMYVEKDGKSFTNNRVQTRFGRGYQSDAERDELYRTEDERYADYSEAAEDWREDLTVHSWQAVQDEAIAWLAERVLFPLQATERPESQAAELPEALPFPHEKIGPMFTFVEMRDMERIKRIQSDPARAYPDERYGIRPGWRLVGLGNGGPGLAREVYDGYVYARPGQLTEDTDLTQFGRIGREYRRTSRFMGTEHGFAQLHPKHAEGVYVVDWSRYAESDVAVARTLTPVTEYDGSFQEPIVIFGRDIELDEITLMFPAPHKSQDT